LVDRLPDDEVDRVAELIAAYESGDRARIAELIAPEVDPEDNEIEALREADQLDDGARISVTEARRKLGLDR
jgi:hypothetical protein